MMLFNKDIVYCIRYSLPNLLNQSPICVTDKLNNCLFVFYVPSTARSFRDSNPIYCPLRRT